MYYYTVLLLEDEALIRTATAEALVEAGHAVVEAETAGQALAHLRDDATVDVLVTDVNLHGSINGCEAGERALQLRPDLRIVITSGVEPDTLPPNSVFLLKPYRLHQLLHAVAGSSLVDSSG